MLGLWEHRDTVKNEQDLGLPHEDLCCGGEDRLTKALFQEDYYRAAGALMSSWGSGKAFLG